MNIRFLSLMAALLSCVSCTEQPDQVLIVIPLGYAGNLLIEENPSSGIGPNVSAYENYGDYVYEFQSIQNNRASVSNIQPILGAKEIHVSASTIHALSVTGIRKDFADKTVRIEITL